MFDLNKYLDSFDLRSVHWSACFVGVLLCIYVMQMWSRGMIGDISECVSINGLRRLGLWLLAFAFCWAMYYSGLHPNWQPWPPDLLAIIAVDLVMIASICGAYLKQHRQQQSRRFDRATPI